MAKIIIHSKRKLQLGLGGNTPQLKPGRNELDERTYELVKDKWFFKALIDSKAIILEEPPKPSFPEIEVEIGPEKIAVIEPEPEPVVTKTFTQTAPEFPVRYTPPIQAEVIKPKIIDPVPDPKKAPAAAPKKKAFKKG